jgi:hypothetical protein
MAKHKKRQCELVITYHDGTIKEFGQKDSLTAKLNMELYEQVKETPAISIVILERFFCKQRNETRRQVLAFRYLLNTII